MGQGNPLGIFIDLVNPTVVDITLLDKDMIYIKSEILPAAFLSLRT